MRVYLTLMTAAMSYNKNLSQTSTTLIHKLFTTEAILYHQALRVYPTQRLNFPHDGVHFNNCTVNFNIQAKTSLKKAVQRQRVIISNNLSQE